jgi:hypothetical protein
MSRLLGRNQRPTVPGVKDLDSSPRAFHQAGDWSRSPVRWQNKYSYGTMGMAIDLGKMTMGPKASMIKFQNPATVPPAPHVALDVAPGLGSPVESSIPYVLHRFYADDLMKPHGSIRVVRLGCDKHTNPILRCFVNSEGLNYRDRLEGMVLMFIELANGLRLSTKVSSQDLCGAWVPIHG